jgi:hypothetical protein
MINSHVLSSIHLALSGLVPGCKVVTGESDTSFNQNPLYEKDDDFGFNQKSEGKKRFKRGIFSKKANKYIRGEAEAPKGWSPYQPLK